MSYKERITMTYIKCVLPGRILLILAGLLGFQTVWASTILPAPQQLSSHVYAWIGPYEGPNKKNQGYRMNMAFVVGKRAVAVIDTGYTAAMAREMLAHIRKITNKPVKYAINTNSQPHRFMGNDIFEQAGATLISHKLEVKRMQAMSGNFTGGIENALGLPKDSVTFPALPDMLVSKTKTLDLGDLDIKIKTHGQSHTPSSLVVEIPKDKVVYVGDILYRGRLLSILPDSSVKNWIATYKKLRSYRDYEFIPGHGKPGKLQAFDIPTLSYLEMLHKHMTGAVENGVDMDASIKSLNQSKYNKLINYKMLSGRNASWAYLEAEKAAFD